MVTEFADLSDTEEAGVEAAKRIGLLLHAHAGKLWVDEDWQMDAMRSAATLRSCSKSERSAPLLLFI